MHKFPSPPISLATALVLFATLTLNLGEAFGQDNTGRTYQCAAKDAVAVEDNGSLNKDAPRADAARKHFDQMIISVLQTRQPISSGCMLQLASKGHSSPFGGPLW